MGGARRRGVPRAGAGTGSSRAVRAAVLAVLGVLSVLLAAGLVLTRGADPGDRLRPAAMTAGRASQAPAGRVTDAGGALRVLHRWDAARAKAWGSGDVEALRGLYVDGSGAGVADVRLLRRYLARGLVVHRLEVQTLSARVVSRSDTVLRLRVTERLAGAVAATSDGARALPRQSDPTTRLVELRRGSDGRWRVASVA